MAEEDDPGHLKPARLMVHDLINDLAAMRMTVELIKKQSAGSPASAAADCDTLQSGLDHAIASARTLSSWLQTQDELLQPKEESELPIVLYVEDNPANIALMERLFRERPSLRLLVAQDATTALSYASSNVLRLILTDINLPEMSGENLIEALQARMREDVPPIVVLSADISSDKVERLGQAGTVAYLPKPFDIDRLFELIDRYCA